MKGYIEKYIGKLDNVTYDESFIYAIFRIVAALSFLQHGGQKIFGVFGGIGGSGQPIEQFGLIWLAGIIELVGGMMIALGIFTRVSAFFAVASMAYAYFIVHLSRGFFPILNGGELALLYLACFLLILKNGGGKFSLERFFLNREIF